MADEKKRNTRTSRRRVYKLDQDCGRGGVVEAVFTAHPEDVRLLRGKEIYFGEILGKHSEVYFVITEDNLREVSAPDVVVRWLEIEIGWAIRDPWTPFDSWTISGHNPLAHLDEEWTAAWLEGKAEADQLIE